MSNGSNAWRLSVPRLNGYKRPSGADKSALSWFCHGFGVAMRTRINTRLTPANPHEYWNGWLLT